MAAKAKEFEVGDKAPDFTMPTDGKGKVSLAKLKGKKVVLYFYPKDDTSGCTREACGFRDSLRGFGSKSVRRSFWPSKRRRYAGRGVQL